ncbi:MAG: glycosyltransferase, partial [archaeon]|nr:glycosyltransferase [archaeon]
KSEESYIRKLKLIIENEIIPNISIYSSVNDLQKKIKLIDEHKIFVLPSKREAMPQVLIEALARGKIVITSKTDGGKEIIEDNKTGFLFNIGDYKILPEVIQKNIKGNPKIQKNAEKEAKKYAWKNLIKQYALLFNQ